MPSENRVTLMGHLGRDPEPSYLPDGTSKAVLSIATNKKFRNRETGEVIERTEWHRCVVWEGRADFAMRYLKTGFLVYVVGELQTRKYDDNGKNRYITEVKVNDLQNLQPRGADSQSSADEGGGPVGDMPDSVREQMDRQGIPSD